MSRSGYSEDGDYDDWSVIRWRGAVTSATRGKRGQAFFKEMLVALDAMPEKRLIRGDLQTEQGEVCALGALGRSRDMNLKPLEGLDAADVAQDFGIARALAQETVWENDGAGSWEETPEQRFHRVRRWVVASIKESGQ